MAVGNDTWKDAVLAYKDEYKCTDWKEAELGCFYLIYNRMKEDGSLQYEVRDHFEQVFGIKYGAFYNRLRKVGVRYAV